MQVQELIQTSYENSKAKGWYDGEPPDFSMRIALVVSELAEALEEHRRGAEARTIWFAGTSSGVPMDRASRGEKPEGILIELTDVVIRLGDLSGYYGFQLCPGRIATLVEQGRDAANRPKLTTFGQWHNFVIKRLLCAEQWMVELNSGTHHIPRPKLLEAANADITHALDATLSFVNWLGISGQEFESAIRIKWAYNLTRPYRHGNKVA